MVGPRNLALFALIELIRILENPRDITSGIIEREFAIREVGCSVTLVVPAA
jgi:hypothetical protein